MTSTVASPAASASLTTALGSAKTVSAIGSKMIGISANFRASSQTPALTR